MMKRGHKLQWSIALILATLLTTGCAGMMVKMMEMKHPDRAFAASKYSYDETVIRIKQAIEAQNMMVVFTADHQAMLRMVDLDTKGMIGIEFFHPRYGKVIVQNDHTAGVEIPLRIVVMEGKMGTMVTYVKPSALFTPYPKLTGLGQELDRVLEKITRSVTT